MTATPTQQPQPVLADPAAVALARAAAQEEAGQDQVGGHVGVVAEDDASVTHLFGAEHAGYRGWRWAVTVAHGGEGTPVSVSEVVLLPGEHALVAPDWVPWHERVRAGDLGVGDLLPSRADDPRLAPAYVASEDPAVEETALEIGLGRVRVLSREGVLDAGHRWHGGDFGPRSDMARSAPANCGTCGFYLRVAGSLGAAFGVCGNEFTPADGHVVHAEYGCGAHSEVAVDNGPIVPVADLVYDDARLDIEVNVVPAATEAALAESAAEAAADTVADTATAHPQAANGTADIRAAATNATDAHAAVNGTAATPGPGVDTAANGTAATPGPGVDTAANEAAVGSADTATVPDEVGTGSADVPATASASVVGSAGQASDRVLVVGETVRVAADPTSAARSTGARASGDTTTTGVRSASGTEAAGDPATDPVPGGEVFAGPQTPPSAQAQAPTPAPGDGIAGSTES
ncbi:hypothetical protein GCM10022243_12340 [Saccharothrix violaceirubra]|uniref:DUF3027 family protein n=1 Tax=Saccharothrix violaceirubra TaxID=413306 RepID=A0A7W7WZE7_9PSEU|nr:DUF3027 domain-containing protein [Saccharothrix violaceirubra]MBB4968733.1 hypothetical protein [Saccharothrix violaceirubra]